MPRPSDDIQELKRTLTHLARLEGRALACADGAVLLEPVRVRDPRPLVEACLAGRPSLSVLQSALELAAPPVSLTPRLLAAAQRDLRVLEASPSLMALTREAPRIFRRHGDINAAWIARKRARLARLAEVMGAAERPDAPLEGATPPWFPRVLELTRFLHGDAGAEAVEQALARLFKSEEGRRRAARRALDELLAELEGRREPRPGPLAETLQALRAAGALPGRSRTRRVLQLLAEYLGLPPMTEGHALERSLPLVPLARAIGESLLARLPSPRGATFRDEAHRFFAHYALAFDPRPRDGTPLQVSRAMVEEGLRELAKVLGRFGGRKLTLAEVLILNPLKLGRNTEAIASLVEAGLPVEKVRKLAALGRTEDFTKLGSAPAVAEAYADWVCTLVPHYAALGLDLPLTPEVFQKLQVPRREALAVLAVCLLKHHTRATPEATEQALARLDSTLGLFQRRPAEAASLVAELSGTSPGGGREAFPDFAAWLGDDALLDRFVHLSRLAGISLSLSQRLRADFDRNERLARERGHLSGLRVRSAAQEERLARLAAGAVATADPARTRRRLEERLRELTALAYERRLDAIFLRILKEVWGISLERLNPGWRDAIRFYLAVDTNRELLGTLLRAAAAGTDIARTLPKNRVWLAEARLRFNVDAWLSPRSREVTLDGKPYRLAVEQDPIEVLRMGIPFDTCLALETGSNAASTVLNAIDANKRVLYLRDARGQILARKLLAVSEDYKLLGYRLYIADSMHRGAITQAFREFCGELAAAARLSPSPSGKPQQLHPGFWYDDGVVSEDALPASGAPPVEAYCASLGLPPPQVWPESLRRESRLFEAFRREDEDAVLAALRQPRADSGLQDRAAEWLLRRLPPERLVELARSCPALATVAIRHAAAEGPLPMFELAGRIADWRVAEEAVDRLERFERSPEVARALVNAALASRRNAPRFDDHGLEHQSVYHLPRLAAHLPIAVSLDLCDRIEPLWRWITEVAPSCADCVQYGEQHLIEALVHRYASARDPATVIRYLERSRASRLARRAALHIASRYALSEEATAPTLPWPRMEPLRPSLPALRALARLRKRAPELDAEPEMLAALLRQSGGALPHGTALPVPQKPPFGALGDLLVQLDLTPMLSRWPKPDDKGEQATIARAFTLLDRHLSGEAVEPEAVASALQDVRKATAPWLACRPILERLVTRPGPGLTEAERAFVAWYLRERTTYHHPELPPELIVTLWRREEVRDALVTVLANTEEHFFSRSLGCIQAAARRMGGEVLVEGLFEAVVEALIAQGKSTAFTQFEDAALFRAALRRAMEKMSVAAAIALYKALSEYEDAAIFLQELSRSRLAGADAFGAQLELERERWQEQVWLMPLEWLQHSATL